MNDLEDFKATYFQECADLLRQLERCLSDAKRGGDLQASINAAFRHVHSIKGGAGMFGLERISNYAHVIEGAFNEARARRCAVDSDFLSAALGCCDVLADLVAAAQGGGPLSDDFESASQLHMASFLSRECEIKGRSPHRVISSETASAKSALPAEPRTFEIYYKPAADLLQRGLEPLLFMRGLCELGEMEVVADTSDVPDFQDIDAVEAYLSWTIRLQTKHGQQEIMEVFAFRSPGCRLEISALAPSNLIEDGDVALADKNQPALTEQRTSSIRVETARIEKLVDLVGEISISQSMVLQQLDSSIIDANPQLYRAITQLLQHSKCLQESVMAIRAQPIDAVFSRMPRIVRDALNESGKLVELQISGGETELDKTIVEQISDPIMHIVRNAIDHGIEPVDARRSCGKPDAGLISLNAEQRGGRIVIEVRDDGRGIDREAVRERAVELRLIDRDAALTDQEIDQLVFRPGLSTARSISGLSGRGVGMDVVHHNIKALGGRVSIRSAPRRGTITTILLPLTLAVLDAMLVRSGAQSLLIPLANVSECVIVDCADIRPVPQLGEFITLRDRQIRIVDLADRMGQPAAVRSHRLQIVIADVENCGAIGLIVDEVCGHRQVVAKSVRDQLGDTPDISGAAILGDGTVAFIVDAEAILSPVRRRQFQRPRAGEAIKRVQAA